tara:strand:- start:756 stop:902 length:147 start_codon:yes stop_codon:yes gene_type:complete
VSGYWYENSGSLKVFICDSVIEEKHKMSGWEIYTATWFGAWVIGIIFL